MVLPITEEKPQRNMVRRSELLQEENPPCTACQHAHQKPRRGCGYCAHFPAEAAEVQRGPSISPSSHRQDVESQAVDLSPADSDLPAILKEVGYCGQRKMVTRAVWIQKLERRRHPV